MLNLLFFTNDPGVQNAARQAMEGKAHTLVMATTYQEAVNILEHIFISLLVVDFNMSQDNCNSLLEHAQNRYPDIPVVTLSSFPLDQMDLAHTTFASYVGSPFLGHELAQIIDSEIQNLVHGGTLTNVSPPSFAQLLEMEGKSCFLRIVEKKTHKGGLLVFKSGKLVDARYREFSPLDAACILLAWDEADIYIQNQTYGGKARINSDLQAIIVKSVHMKDEGACERNSRPAPARQEDFPRQLGIYLEKQLGKRSGIKTIFHDPGADGRIRDTSALGQLFNLGTLKLGCADEGNETGLFVAGPVPTTVIPGAQSPLEKITLLIAGYLDTL